MHERSGELAATRVWKVIRTSASNQTTVPRASSLVMESKRRQRRHDRSFVARRQVFTRLEPYRRAWKDFHAPMKLVSDSSNLFLANFLVFFISLVLSGKIIHPSIFFPLSPFLGLRRDGWRAGGPGPIGKIIIF